MKYPKLYIGPMSKNVVDSVIEYSKENKIQLGLIPSRRQVDFGSGYVNGWTTKSLCDYVYSKTSFVTMVRDHGGPFQGTERDLGYDSFAEDSNNLDVIHIDPWRETNFKTALEKTSHYIKFCQNLNDNVVFEIGTEEAIYGYEADQLDELINYLKDDLFASKFKRIKIAVIQSGTSLHDGLNTGSYSEQRLKDMIAICKQHELISKEHNGDFLDAKLIKAKFKQGLDCINIAPEFGQMETSTIVSKMNDKQKETFYKLCLESGKWKKWTSDKDNKDLIINITGHYIFSDPKFKKLKSQLDCDEIDASSKDKMKNRIHSILKGAK